MRKLLVSTYCWHDPNGRHNDKYVYGLEDVRRLQQGVADNLTVPHDFAVITDRPELFEGEEHIRVIKLDMTTHVPGRCYCRLFSFHPDGKEIFGEKMLQLDLDTVVVGNMDDIVNRDENLVLWHNPRRIPWVREPGGPPFYNTSMVMHRCGTMPELFTGFDPIRTPQAARDDQWLLSGVLGPDMPYWDQSHGVYRLAVPGYPKSGVEGELPDNAKIVFFPGDGRKPWLPEIQARNPWLRNFYGATGRENSAA